MLQSPGERQIRRRRAATQKLARPIVCSKGVVESADRIERDGVARICGGAQAGIADASCEVDGSLRGVQARVRIAGESCKAGAKARRHVEIVAFGNALQRAFEPAAALFRESVPIEELGYAARDFTAERELARCVTPAQRGANILQVAE